MDVARLKDYILAREALGNNDRTAALRHLASSLGAPEGSSVVQQNLDRLLNIDSPAGEMALHLVAANVHSKRST
jgi:hypothetical protein